MTERTPQELIKDLRSTNPLAPAGEAADHLEALEEELLRYKLANTNNLKANENLHQIKHDQEQQIKELEAQTDDRRASLAQEIEEALSSKGHWTGNQDSDLIIAVGVVVNQLTTANERIKELEEKVIDHKQIIKECNNAWYSKLIARDKRIKELEENLRKEWENSTTAVSGCVDEIKQLKDTLAAIGEKIEILRIRNLPKWHRKTSQQNNLLLCEQIITLIAKQKE